MDQVHRGPGLPWTRPTVGHLRAANRTSIGQVVGEVIDKRVSRARAYIAENPLQARGCWRPGSDGSD